MVTPWDINCYNVQQPRLLEDAAGRYPGHMQGQHLVWYLLETTLIWREQLQTPNNTDTEEKKSNITPLGVITAPGASRPRGSLELLPLLQDNSSKG